MKALPTAGRPRSPRAPDDEENRHGLGPWIGVFALTDRRISMMRARLWLPLIVLIASLLAQVAAASDFQERRFNFVPFAGWTFFDKELKAASGLMLNDDLYVG